MARTIANAPLRTRPLSLLGTFGVAFTLAIMGFIGIAAGTPVGGVVRPSTSDEFVNISATTNFAFDPSQFTVTPGATVHLVFHQLSTTNHTFVLSPIDNFAFTSSNTTGDLVHFFQAHSPLVNLSLPGTVGATQTATFTAPAAGSYEYVCVVQDHFAGGMHGMMVSSTAVSTSPSMSSTTLYIVVGVVVLIVIIAIAAVMMRGRSKTPPASGGNTGTP